VLFTLLGVSVRYGHRRIRTADPLTAFPFMISRQGKYKKRYDHVPDLNIAYLGTTRNGFIGCAKKSQCLRLDNDLCQR